jgi:hypothetical protein
MTSVMTALFAELDAHNREETATQAAAIRLRAIWLDLACDFETKQLARARRFGFRPRFR